ncbi:hypothetical protein B566_EDAN007814 [Ephemera danica]|nr:hypothetical protein B566_EDAN007814 [Ephemera danica]
MAKEGSGKIFRLKWDNHLQNLSCLFENLYVQQKYVDVTLFCDGGSLKAHKVVLSSCSSYFESIFRDHPCKHPVVIIHDVKIKEMQMVLEYMYKGELNVLEEELNSFVEIASLLDVRGLSNVPKEKEELSSAPTATTVCEEVASDSLGIFPCENGNGLEIVAVPSGSFDSQNLNTGEDSPDRQSTPLSFTDVLQDMLGRQSTVDTSRSSMQESSREQQRQRRPIETFTTLGPEPKKSRIKEEYIPPESPVEILGITNSGMEATMTEEQVEEKTECNVCKLHFMTPSLLQAHLQDEHNYTEDYRPHRCDFCPLAFYRSAHLKRHRRLHTGEKPFACEFCGKSFSRQDKLKQHVQRHGPQVSTATQRGRSTGRPSRGRPSPRPVFPASTRQQPQYSELSYMSSVGVQQRQDVSAEQLLRTVQDLGECIIQPCLPRS